MLVIVLALLVVLSLLASSVASSSRQAVAEAAAEQDRFQSELDQLSSRETLLFMLSTHRSTLAGLRSDYVAPNNALLESDELEMLVQGSEIRLDSSEYSGLGDAQFALQDDRGLLSLNWAAGIEKQAFYASLGAPGPAWPDLEAKRLDYQDADELHRLGGAEAEHYRKAGLPEPSNRTLSSPLEFRRVLQWKSLLEPLSDEQLLDQLTMVRSVDINLNTAPKQVIALLPGLNAAEGERLVALRRLAPVTSIAEFQQAFPLVPGAEDLVSLFPIPSGNLTLWDRRFGTKRLIHWTLTPLGDSPEPWRIDYEVLLPRGNQSDQPVAGTPQAPLFPAQNTAQ